MKGYPRAWREFWEPVYSLSRNLGIDVNAVLEVFKLVHECVSKEEEGRPLSTGFLIGDAEKLKERLPDLVGMELRKQSIFELTKTIRSLFGLVDGYTSAFIVGKNGTVEDARLLPGAPPDPDESSFTYVEFNGYCEALKDTPGYGLVASGLFKTAKLFHDGDLRAEVYFSGKVGDWVHRSLGEVKEKLDRVALEKGIDPRVLYRIFTTAITMSSRVRLRTRAEQGWGGARRAERLLAHPERGIATCLVGNTLVNAAIAAYGRGALLRLYPFSDTIIDLVSTAILAAW